MLPNDLSVFSVEQLRGFVSANREQYDAVSADEALEAESKTTQRESLLNARDRLNAEIEARLAAEAADEAVDAASAAEGDDDGEGEKPADDEKPAEGDEAADGDATPKPDEAEGNDADAAVDDAVAAASMGGGATAPRATSHEARRAGGDVKKFVQRLGGGAGRISHEERHSFVTMQRETKHIVREGGLANDAIRAAAISRAADEDMTAAGCFCGPDDAVTSIKECGETVRPISDTLPMLTVSGDIRYIRQIDLAGPLTGVTQWTCADQALVDPDDIATWKPCFELDCEPEVESALYAVSACASFTTQQFIGNQELIANLEHVMQVAYSKVAELLVYNRLRDLSSKYEFGYSLDAYGAGAQLLAAVGWAMEQVKATLRETDPGYTLAIPAGLKERIVTDGFLTGGREPDETWAVIVARLNELGVNRVVLLVDEIVCAPGGALAHTPTIAPVAGCVYVPAPAHPVEQELLLYRPEDFVLGVAPEIDLGITRSPELARQNRLQWFVESFEFVEKVGCAPAINLLVPFCASGIRAALGDGENCTVEGP